MDFWLTLISITIALLIIAFLLYQFVYVEHCIKKNKDVKLKYWFLVIAILICSIGVGVGVPTGEYIYNQKYIYNTKLYTTDNIHTFYENYSFENIKNHLNVDDDELYISKRQIEIKIDKSGYIKEFRDAPFYFKRSGKMIKTCPVKKDNYVEFLDTNYYDYQNDTYNVFFRFSLFKDTLSKLDWDILIDRQPFGTDDILIWIDIYMNDSISYNSKTFCEIKDNEIVYHNDEPYFMVDGLIFQMGVQSNNFVGLYVMKISDNVV